jgi:sulfur-carrier protein
MSSTTTPPTDTGATGIRIAMPVQLRQLARVSGEVTVEVRSPCTVAATLDALEACHPTLVGTIRDRETGQRRPMIRIYGDGEDLSDAPRDALLPLSVIERREPLRLVGAIAGG